MFATPFADVTGFATLFAFRTASDFGRRTEAAARRLPEVQQLRPRVPLRLVSATATAINCFCPRLTAFVEGSPSASWYSRDSRWNVKSGRQPPAWHGPAPQDVDDSHDRAERADFVIDEDRHLSRLREQGRGQEGVPVRTMSPWRGDRRPCPQAAASKPLERGPAKPPDAGHSSPDAMSPVIDADRTNAPVPSM